MADEDVVLQTYLFRSILVCLVLGLIWQFRSYSKTYKLKLFAWIMNRTANRMNKIFSREKHQIFEYLQRQHEELGRNLVILEIGCGAAPNVDFYPTGSEIIGLDPNPHFESYVESSVAKQKNIQFKGFLKGFAEKINFDDDSFDAVVCTFVMCSVKDPVAVVKEVRRVLKVGGKFVFIEHVAGQPGTLVYKFQCFFNPVWSIVCQLNRKTWTYIQDAGFSDTHIELFRVKSWLWPFFVKPGMKGFAVK